MEQAMMPIAIVCDATGGAAAIARRRSNGLLVRFGLRGPLRAKRLVSMPTGRQRPAPALGSLAQSGSIPGPASTAPRAVPEPDRTARAGCHAVWPRLARGSIRDLPREFPGWRRRDKNAP